MCIHAFHSVTHAFLLVETYTQMLIVSLLVIGKNWKQPDAHQCKNGYTNCGISIPWNTSQQ